MYGVNCTGIHAAATYHIYDHRMKNVMRGVTILHTIEGQRQMESSDYGENVRPVRARKKGRKMRRERERERNYV